MKESKWYFCWKLILSFREHTKETWGIGLTTRFCKISPCWDCNCLHIKGIGYSLEVPFDWIIGIRFNKLEVRLE
jgi:hypothetical protein